MKHPPKTGAESGKLGTPLRSAPHLLRATPAPRHTRSAPHRSTHSTPLHSPLHSTAKCFLQVLFSWTENRSSTPTYNKVGGNKPIIVDAGREGICQSVPVRPSPLYTDSGKVSRGISDSIRCLQIQVGLVRGSQIRSVVYRFK